VYLRLFGILKYERKTKIKNTEQMRILIADWVPRKNKGEMAILGGLRTIYESHYPQVHITYFDQTDAPIHTNAETVLPLHWVYPYYHGFFYQHHRLNLVFTGLLALLHLTGIRLFANRVHSRSGKFAEMAREFEIADTIIVGHDGVFSVYGANVLLAITEFKKDVMMIGSGFRLPKVMPMINRLLFKKAISTIQLGIFRERSTYAIVQELMGQQTRFWLLPDPGFYLKAGEAENAKSLIVQLFGILPERLVVMTVCERSVVFKAGFPSIKGVREKRIAHTSLLGSIADSICRTDSNVRILFLPHSIQGGDDNDVAVAQRVVESMDFGSRAMVLDDDLSESDLKALIAQSSFFIGERTHSVIAAASLGVPFVALTNSRDTRTHEIFLPIMDSPPLIDIDLQTTQEISQTIRRYMNDSAQTELTFIKDRLSTALTKYREILFGTPALQ
jgi:hypothetical protein